MALGILVLLAGGAWAGMSLLGSDDKPEPEPVAASPTSSEDDIKKEKLIERGDALCKRAAAAQERLLIPGSPAEFGPYLDRVRGILVGLLKDLRELPRPKQERPLLMRMFSQIDKLPPLLTDARAAALAGDSAALERLIARGEKIEHRANTMALRYGFVECSQP